MRFPYSLPVFVLATVGASAALAQQHYFVAERFSGDIYLLRDLNGDGDALDVDEKVLWASAPTSAIDLRHLDSTVLAMDRDADRIIRLHDLNGDSDALDAGESTVWADGFGDALGLSVGAASVVYATELSTNEVWRLADLNGDGDALDRGEKVLFATGIDGPTGVQTRQSDVLVTAFFGNKVHRLTDSNGDGDALDVGENVTHTPDTLVSATGLMLDRNGGFYVSLQDVDAILRVQDFNGDGDALDVGEVTTYADSVFGKLNGPSIMAPYPGGGFLVTEFDDNEVTLVRDNNGDGDALDVGEVILFASGIDSTSGLLAGMGPGPAGTMIVIQDGPGTLDIAAPSFIAIVEQSTVDKAAINSVLDSGTNALVSSNDPTSFGPGKIVQNANAAIEKSGGDDTTLSIRADDTIELHGGITATTGVLHLELIANDAAQSEHDQDPTTGDVVVAAAISTNGGDLTVSGVGFDNTGGAITANLITMNHTGTITVGAPLEAGTLSVTAGGGWSITSTGRLAGEGLIVGDGNNAGRFAPGNSTGTLQITGSYAQNPLSGVLEMTIGGTSINAYDQLLITGTAGLGGVLDVDLIGGFSPMAGDRFELVTAAGGIVGKFDDEDLPLLSPDLTWYVNYGTSLVALEVFLIGDLDCDGDVDFDDIDDFVQGLSDPSGYEAIYSLPPEVKGDADRDGDLDFDDIDDFVTLLNGPMGRSISAIPEPPALALLLAGVSCLAALRKPS